MTLRLDQLPASLRKKILTGNVTARSKAAAAPARERSFKGHWRCKACAAETNAWSQAEEHSDELGHRRIEIVLP